MFGQEERLLVCNWTNVADPSQHVRSSQDYEGCHWREEAGTVALLLGLAVQKRIVLCFMFLAKTRQTFVSESMKSVHRLYSDR